MCVCTDSVNNKLLSEDVGVSSRSAAGQNISQGLSCSLLSPPPTQQTSERPRREEVCVRGGVGIQ